MRSTSFRSLIRIVIIVLYGSEFRTQYQVSKDEAEAALTTSPARCRPELTKFLAVTELQDEGLTTYGRRDPYTLATYPALVFCLRQ
jgi:hypothetical protein